MAATSLDPITLEIQWQRLVAIADEMDNATIRASFSTIVGESHDFGCILMDQNGSAIAQAQFSPPQFCTMLPITTGHMLRRFPKHTLQDGDVLITNDPWLGSTHLPDYNLVTPMFRKGKVVAFFGTVAHVSDVGGHLGDLEAYDVFMEGIRILPAKFYKAGQPNEELIEIIEANCRVPENVLGDLRAIVGTHRMAMRQLQEFMDDYDLDDLEVLSAAIQDRSEAALRRAITALPDGVYTHEATGDGYLEPFMLKVAIQINGSAMHFDFAGSSPQQPNAAINAAWNMTYATSVYPIKCMLVPHVPNNDGLVRPLTVVAPEGSIVNCTFPAPVKARAKVMKHIPPLIFGALAPLLPRETIAAAGGIFPFHFNGHDRRFGRFNVHVLPHGGMGAMHNADGHPPVAYPHNSTVTPAEIMELRSPVLMLRKSLIPDSGGAGRQRGGLGVEYVLKCVAEGPITLTIRPDLLRNPAPGLFEGGSGAPGAVFVNGERLERFIPIQFNPGDICVLRVPGGGGYGPPRERPADLVRQDVELGFVSAESARTVYGVEV
ncbi:MAG: hydantoinase B/oxoprolinase family protein [Chloroflexaceae bacterium]|jgi:N-methylhydantoinase B|nr:hydantoinase B/oxoprolinase family protein [Chloroflexaceae bacterium]